MSREEPILKDIIIDQDPRGAGNTCSSCRRMSVGESKDVQTDTVCSESLKALVIFFQELMTEYIEKFEEFKVSEYGDRQVKEVNKKETSLSSSELQFYIPKLRDHYDDFFMSIYEKMKDLKHQLQNEKSKSAKFAERGSNDSKMRHHREVSSERAFQTLSDTKYNADNFYNETLKDLKKKNSKLEAKNEDLTNKNDELESENRDFRSKIKNLKNDLNKQIELKDEVEEDLTNEIKQLQKKIDNKESERNDNKIKGSYYSSDVSERNINKELENKIETLIESYRVKESDEQGKASMLHEQIKFMREEMKTLKSNSPSGTTVKSNEDKEIQTNDEQDKFDRKEAESQKEVLKVRVIELEGVIAKKDTAFQNITAKIRSLMENEKNFIEKIEGLENTNSELRDENNKLNGTLESRYRALLAMKLKIKDINNCKDGAEELSTCKRQNQQAKIENEKLASKVESLEMKLKNNNGEFEDLKKERLRLEVEMENMKKLNFKKKTEGDMQA